MPSINLDQTNPFSSNIVDVFLASSKNLNNPLSIIDKTNGICQFEKIEFVESIFDILPSGVVVVRDTSDAISYITNNNIDVLVISYTGSIKEYYSITGTSHLNNAASQTEENFISINFTNFLYKHSQTHSTSELLQTTSPQVSWIDDFIKILVDAVSANLEEDLGENLASKINLPSTSFRPPLSTNNLHSVSNFVHYKPLNTLKNIIDVPNDNYLQYVNYLSTMACEYSTKFPRFMFWTDFGNRFNFKFMYAYPESDPDAVKKMEKNQYYFAIYESDMPLQKISNGGGKQYKKIYTFTSSPANEFISKKYFYVRKTPKLLNKRITTNPYKELAYQFQDDGEKYDIEYISSDGRVEGTVPAGSDEMDYEGSWGYYGSISKDTLEKSTLLTGEYGNVKQYYQKDIFGNSEYFPFVDNQEMWKNIYDFTPLSPWYPELTQDHLTESGSASYLQKVMNVRYNTIQDTGGESEILKRSKEIENYNLVAYVLCCNKGMEEETFYAILTGYKPDERVPTDTSYLSNTSAGGPSAWTYRWCKLKYDAQYEDQNDDLTYAMNELTQWKLDTTEKTNEDDETSWAVNLNERRNAGRGDRHYFGPGWFDQGPSTGIGPNTQLMLRPIGMGAEIPFKKSISCYKEFTRNPQNWFDEAFANSPLVKPCGGASGVVDNYYRGQVVRMTKTPAAKLLMEAGITEKLIWDKYGDKYLYTFDATNIIDGPCDSE